MAFVLEDGLAASILQRRELAGLSEKAARNGGCRQDCLPHILNRTFDMRQVPDWRWFRHLKL
jgi:hypothetical protein